MRTSRNVVWSDPTADRNGGEIESLDKDDHVKIANDLAGKIAEVITNGYANRDIVKNLVSNAIKEQIRQYLREYDNVVAEDILNSLKGWILGDVKGWQAEIDFEYTRHGKLSTFGKELKKEFDRLKKENQLEQVKKRIMGLNPEPDSICENNDGKVWLSNVLTIIDEEMNGYDKGPPAMECETDTKQYQLKNLEDFDDMPNETPEEKTDNIG